MFVAVGAHLSKKTDIPARDAGKILDAVDFSRMWRWARRPSSAARSPSMAAATRHGCCTGRHAARPRADDHLSRTREQMPAHEFEADEALEEGVKIHWLLRTIKSIDASTFTVEVMEIDDEGRPKPTGELETLEANDLILALGQDTDTAFLRNPGSSSRTTAPWS